jgi:hypothetical protein
MLDSDVGNSVLPMVRFYQKEMLHKFNTDKENRPVYYMADRIRIEIPGRQDTIIDTIANEWHKKEYPQQWARFMNEKKSLEETEVTGTLLKDWTLLTPAQARELRHYHFYTIEQVSLASDAQLNEVQMIVGMGAHVFRDKAKAYLAAARGASEIENRDHELQKRDIEIADLKEQMQKMMDMMQTKPVEKPVKRGRKPKVAAE